MADITWLHAYVPELLAKIPLDARRILDLGCGKGLIGYLMISYREPEWLVGVDVFPAYLEHCRYHNLYDETICMNLAEDISVLERSFDTIVAADLLEHMPKEAGSRLLDRIAEKGRAILAVTASFQENPEYDGNPNMKRLSSWETGEFQKKGFQCQGIGGWILAWKT